MKILQLCNKPPYPPVDGGTLAMNSITQGLLAEGCEVRVLSVCSDKHPVLHDQMTDEYLEKTHFESQYVDLGVHVPGAFVAMMCGESYHVKRFESNDFALKLKRVLEEEDFDIVHLESVFLTPYVPIVRKYSSAKVVLRAHNVEHKIWRHVANGTRNPFKAWYVKHLSLTLGAYEREHCNDYDAIVSITPEDACFFKEAGCRKRIEAIPFAVNPEPLENVAVESDTLFHIGSMDWIPNQEGIRWFLDKVWPIVHAQTPQVKLYLAGRKMPQDLMDLQVEGVQVVGEVSDAMYFIGSKQINVVPLLSGSGIRVKIIEAMSAGKTVISTTVGAAGINYTDGENILIADTPEQFARQVRRCVEDPDFCSRVGASAYALIANEYSQEKLTKRLLDFYEKLTNR